MQEKPNSRWQVRPPVASHTFCRSPGGPPAAATIASPGRACSCSTPMIWPWVSTASVSVTTSESAGTVDLSNSWSGSSAAARSMRPGVGELLGPGPATPAGWLHAGAATASARAARARLASPTMPVAPSRSASWTLTLIAGEPHVGVGEDASATPVAKSVSRDPTVSTRSASRARALVAGVPSSPMPPSCHHAACWTAPLPAKVSGDRDAADAAASALQLGGGVGVDDPAAGDDERLLRAAARSCGDRRDLVGVGRPAGGSPSRARRRTRPGSRRRGTGRPGAATAPRRRSRPGRPGRASRAAARSAAARAG